jgi:hypothetical protein
MKKAENLWSRETANNMATTRKNRLDQDSLNYGPRAECGQPCTFYLAHERD